MDKPTHTPHYQRTQFKLAISGNFQNRVNLQEGRMKCIQARNKFLNGILL